MNPSPIPVGAATKAGLTGAASSFALALAAFIAGDRSTETIGALASGLVLLVVTQVGRYAQAVARAKSATVTNNLTSAELAPRKGTMSVSLPNVTLGDTSGPASSGPQNASEHVQQWTGGGFADVNRDDPTFGKVAHGVRAVRSWVDPDDTDDDDLPADPELVASSRIPVDPVGNVLPDEGDAGRPYVELDKAEGGQA